MVKKTDPFRSGIYTSDTRISELLDIMHEIADLAPWGASQ